MSYATLTDLIERAGSLEILQVADRDHDGTADPDVVAAALTDAGNKIDGYLATKYDTPLTAVPDLVRTWAVSIARYILHRDGAPDYVRRDYDDAVAALKDVARGLVMLPKADGEAPATAAGVVTSEHPPAVFTPEKLRGW